MAIGGVVLIFSSKALILRLFLHPPAGNSMEARRRFLKQ
jgi:hypothetical protein